MNAADELIEILEFYIFKLKKNGCTMEEIESAKNTLVENMEIDGTISDFANFYGQSKDAVNSAIKRRMLEKPRQNIVLYPFHSFIKIRPRGWSRKKL